MRNRNSVKVRRDHKDTLFRMIFSTREKMGGREAVTECIEENILADFLRKNRTEAIEVCIFEYDEKREKELIRKAEYAEGKKEGLKEGLERVLEIYRLYRDKYTENQIAEQMKIDVNEVRKILEKFKE